MCSVSSVSCQAVYGSSGQLLINVSLWRTAGKELTDGFADSRHGALHGRRLQVERSGRRPPDHLPGFVGRGHRDRVHRPRRSRHGPRGGRAALIGAAAGFAVLAVVVAFLGVALTAIPIGPLRVLIGTLLLLFGLQWYRKGIARVAARGLAGMGATEVRDDDVPASGMDWVAFLLTFKGVLLEGLEIALIVVSFGVT